MLYIAYYPIYILSKQCSNNILVILSQKCREGNEIIILVEKVEFQLVTLLDVYGL